MQGHGQILEDWPYKAKTVLLTEQNAKEWSRECL